MEYINNKNNILADKKYEKKSQKNHDVIKPQ